MRGVRMSDIPKVMKPDESIMSIIKMIIKQNEIILEINNNLIKQLANPQVVVDSTEDVIKKERFFIGGVI